MTAITDATLVIETLIGRTLTGAQLTNIGDSFVQQDPYHKGGWTEIANPGDPVQDQYLQPRVPTTEEKAQLIIDTFGELGRTILRTTAESNKREADRDAFEASIITEGNTAVLDMT